MLLTTVTVVFLAVYGTLIFYYFVHWTRLKEEPLPAEMPSVFVSVVVAARNEEKTLPLLLADLARQTYPKKFFEVIVVNDFSTDGTAAAVHPFTAGNVAVIQPEAAAETSSKKLALTTGIKKAKGELMVVTDADCRVGELWLQTVASFYAEREAAFVAAPVAYTEDGSLLQVFQALDFITLQGITAAGVSAGFHSMCNGANLAYTKQAFTRVNGFAGIDKVASGDDMLLMHKISKAHPNRVWYLKNREALVATEPAKNWTEFLAQRRRWASKTLVYDDYRVLAVLAFVLLFNLLFFVLLASACFNKWYWLHALFFLVGKTVVEWPLVASVAAFFGKQKLMRYFFFLQPLHVFYTVFVGLLSQFGHYQWKGRRTR